jgi:hypothetical protein
MGGMQTRQITLANLDKFSHIGIFSGGSIAPTNITDMAAFKQKVKVLFVSYGSRELSGNRPGFGGDPKANTGSPQGRGREHLLLCVSGHGSRVAILATQSASVCATAVPGPSRFRWLPRRSRLRHPVRRLLLSQLALRRTRPPRCDPDQSW